MEQTELQQKYQERYKWFMHRVGKRIYRNKTSCTCKTCANVYQNGLIIGDEMHAQYLHDGEGELEIQYFDTIAERDEYEKTLK